MERSVSDEFATESPTREYPPEAWSLEELQLMARLEARRARLDEEFHRFALTLAQGAPQ